MPQDIMVEQKLFEVQAQAQTKSTWHYEACVRVCVCVFAEHTISDGITATI